MKLNLKYLIIIVLIATLTSCGSSSETGDITIKVREVVQVQDYTYMLVKGKKSEYWIAVPSMEAQAGDTYHYQGGMEMTDFYSKDLDRTFEKVLFVEALFSGDEAREMTSQEMTSHGMTGHGMTPGSTAPKEKSSVKIEKVEGALTIAEIYADPSALEGKSIRVKGEVTKFNPAIMERNWIHLQDGTEFDGKFDLTVTSNEAFTVGTVVILEGILAVNMDFGYGYSYEVLLEAATAVQ